jgi:hypothetical protein
VPLTDEQRSEHARELIRSRWANTTPEFRRAATHKARVAGAVKTVVKNWAELTDDQRRVLSDALAKGGVQ